MTPEQFHHDLADHGALTIDALARVAQQLSPTQVEAHEGQLPLLLPEGDAVEVPGPIAEAITRIESTCCWVMLRALERVDPYGDLARATVAERQTLSVDHDPIVAVRATAFVASPRAVVPAHVDSHHNLLLQIRGTKRLFLGWFDDARDHDQIERTEAPHPRNLDRLPTRTVEVELRPGTGVYVPPLVVHWVVGGDDASISLSCMFETERSRRGRAVLRTNARLRRVGLTPRAPGASEWRDAGKVTIDRLTRRLTRRRRTN